MKLEIKDEYLRNTMSGNMIILYRFVDHQRDQLRPNKPREIHVVTFRPNTNDELTDT